MKFNFLDLWALWAVEITGETAGQTQGAGGSAGSKQPLRHNKKSVKFPKLIPENIFPDPLLLIQKNPRVRKIVVRNSGAGNGCANFMGAWKNAFFLQEEPMSIKFLLLGGGGVFWVLGGGGECRFYFYGRTDFSE